MDRSRVEQLAEQGNKRAQATARALRTLSFQLSGAQLGITITSLLVGFLIEPAIAPLVEPVFEAVGVPVEASLGASVAVALVVVTALEMVLAELAPKNLAIARPLPMAFGTARSLTFINGLFRPFIVFLNSSANLTVRLFGIEPREELSEAHSLEELQILIRSSREGGTLDEEEFSLLARSITFREKSAADALIPRTAVDGLQLDTTVSEMMAEAVETGHSRFPVYGTDLDDVAGIAHVKDGYAIEIDQRPRTPISKIIRPALVVPESRNLASLLAEMRRERQQLVIVVDEYGGTAGIITLEDLLEEIVGEIEDEYDPAEEHPGETAAGVHVISGMLHGEEVLERTGFEMPEGDYETLAGFLLSKFERIPEVGQHATHDGWEFKVTQMDDRRIAEVLMVAPPETEPEEDSG